MAKRAHNTPEKRPLPFALIDLDAHPDGALMRMCAQAIAVRDRCAIAGIDVHGPSDRSPDPNVLFKLTCAIVDAPARTREGLKMKALFAIGDETDIGKVLVSAAPAVSVVYDVLRWGVLS